MRDLAKKNRVAKRQEPDTPATEPHNTPPRTFRVVSDRHVFEGTHLPQLYDRWLKAKGDRAYAPSGSIPIADFPFEANLWAMLDVLDDGANFRVNFAGPLLVEVYGGTLVGLRMSEILENPIHEEFKDALRNTLDIYRLVVKTGQPVVNGPTERTVLGQYTIRFQTLNLPMGTRDNHKSTILVAFETLPLKANTTR